MLAKSPVTYNPGVFDIETFEDAKSIILTPERDLTVDWRWEHETPYLIDQILSAVELNKSSVVLDYGCGIGRLAKRLIEQTGCTVIGADISANMRGLACSYVESDKFIACHPSTLEMFCRKADLVLAVWVLQHCYNLNQAIGDILNVMCPTAKLFLVNQQFRAVPVREEPFWANDGQDVFQCLQNVGLKLLFDKPMDREHVGKVDEFATIKLYNGS